MTVESSPVEEHRGARIRAILLRQDVLLLVVFIAMIAFFSILNPRFFSAAAAANILQDFSPVMLMAIGQAFVILSGGIDLSVGAVLGLSGVTTAMIIRDQSANGSDPGAAIVMGLLAGVAVGALVGLVNGLLITYGRLAPFIATLATMGAAAGITLVVTGGVQIAGAPRELILLGNTTYLGIFTIPVMVVLVIAALSWLWVSRTRFGRWTYAIGSNSFAARGAGINVRRHLLKIYVISGILAALAGAFVYFRLGSGSPLSGRGGELNAIAAVVVGGIALTGGIGRLSGVILGSLIITAVLSGLIIIGVEPNWQQVVIGALIAVAVGIQGIGSFKGKTL
jgi:ribose transport system permease protein